MLVLVGVPRPIYELTSIVLLQGCFPFSDMKLLRMMSTVYDVICDCLHVGDK